MTATMLLTALVALLPADAVPPKVNPIAPSLPVLTQEQEERIERVIDRFILYDCGKLPPAEGAKALADFKALGPEATLQLIDGLNRAANLQFSCPAVIIGRKLSLILNSTEDVALLDFARENIGAEVTVRRHMGTIQDLRLSCILRKSALQRRALAGGTPGQKFPRQMSVKELAEAAGSAHGPRLKAVLLELEQRQGEQVVAALSTVAATSDDDSKQLAQNLLVRHLARQNTPALRARLQADQAAVRAAAARAIGNRGLPYGEELIALLSDNEAEVRLAARQGLVQLSRGQDFGPFQDGSETARAEAVRQWQAWWNKQGKR